MGPLKPLLRQHLPSVCMASGLGQLPSHSPSLTTLQLVKQRWEQYCWPVTMPPQCCGTPEPPQLCLMHLPAADSLVPLQTQHSRELVSSLDPH